MQTATHDCVVVKYEASVLVGPSPSLSGQSFSSVPLHIPKLCMEKRGRRDWHIHRGENPRPMKTATYCGVANRAASIGIHSLEGRTAVQLQRTEPRNWKFTSQKDLQLFQCYGKIYFPKDLAWGHLGRSYKRISICILPTRLSISSYEDTSTIFPSELVSCFTTSIFFITSSIGEQAIIFERFPASSNAKCKFQLEASLEKRLRLLPNRLLDNGPLGNIIDSRHDQIILSWIWTKASVSHRHCYV